MNPHSALHSPRYTVAEAARLAGTSAANVRRWLFGYEAPGHRMEPVFARRDREPRPLVPFVVLCELAVVAAFRRAEPAVTLERLRRAHAYAREALGLEHPFASERIRSEGGHVLYDFARRAPGPGTLVLDLHGQMVLPIAVCEVLDRFDFGDGQVAVRWHLFGRQVPLVVDPERGAGQPTVEGRNLRAEVLFARWTRGEDIPALAEDFDIEAPVVEAALRSMAA